MPGYLGNDPSGSATKIARQTYTTSGAATTDFTFTSGYDVGYLDVYVNGERQTKGKNFTASDGSTFKVLNGGVGTGSTVEAIAYKTFNLATVDFDDLGNTGNLTLSGDISAVNGTFSGDVSIGGTLTYEDVTNVDSVGLVTARSGLRVVGGGLTVTGVSTFFSTVSIGDSIVHTGDTNTSIRFPAADTFTVETAGDEALRIDSSGRLLKGKTSTTHSHPLQIVSSTNSNAIAISGDATDDISEITFYENDDSTILGQIQHKRDHAVIRHRVGYLRFDTGGLTERVRITSGGDVGIGTTIPGGKLQIDGGELLVGTKTVKNVASTTNATAIFRDDGGAHTIIAVESNSASGGGVLALSGSRNNTDDGFTILQDGDVMGEIRFAGDDGTNLQHSGARIMAEVDGTPAEDDMPGRLEFHTNPGGTSTSERLRIGKNGHVSIAGNYTQTSYALQVTGTINATTDVKINGASAATTGKAIAMALIFG